MNISRNSFLYEIAIVEKKKTLEYRKRKCSSFHGIKSKNMLISFSMLTDTHTLAVSPPHLLFFEQ